MTTKQTKSALVHRILALAPGEQFDVATKSERGAALVVAKTLRDAGRIEFRLRSFVREDGTFTLIAAQ